MEKLKVIGEQLLPTVAYGDAAGLPFEKQPALKPDSLQGLEDTRTNPFIGAYEAGTWSDDTHLSLATTKALIAAKGFSLAAQASAHMRALQAVRGELDPEQYADWIPPIVTTSKQNGWGGSTTHAVERLMDKVSPLVSGEPDGAGNGVLMKMAPVVYWQEACGTETNEAASQIVDFTKMTHLAPEAVVSSLVHRRMLVSLLHEHNRYINQGVVQPEWYQLAVSSALVYEHTYDKSHKTSKVLQRLDPFTVAERKQELSRSNIITAAEKDGFYAPETLLMVYGSFILESGYPNSVYRAVELGGDSDSVGSIVATLSLFLHGNLEKPHDYQEIFEVERLERVSKKLAQVALNGEQHGYY